jgi:hypothetical protein
MKVGLPRSNQTSNVYVGNQYIIVATNYMTKWVEVRVLRDNTTISIAKFFYEDIITRFSSPTHLVSDQGSHFIDNFIELLVQEFMITHHKYITYSSRKWPGKINQ